MKTNFKKYHFVNLPKPLEKSDYQEICDLVVSRLKNNPAIKSIYLSSGRWVPGISDLDIIIIRKAEISEKIPSPWSLSEKAKYIFTHNFWELDEESFKNLRYIVPGISLKLLWGKDISIYHPQNKLPSEEYQFFNAIIIFDFLINKLLFFPRYLEYTQLNARQILGEVYSLVYTLDALNLIGVQTIKTDFPKRIRQLRETWFIHNQEENLQELTVLLKESIDLILEIVIRLDDFVKKHNLPTNKFIFKNRKYYIISDKNWTKEKFTNNFLKGYISVKRPFSNRVLENFKLVLPESLSYFLMAYAGQKGILSDWIKKSLGDYREISVNQGAYQHIKTINSSAQAGIEYGFARIPFPYGLLIRSQTLLSRLGDILVLSLRKVKK